MLKVELIKFYIYIEKKEAFARFNNVPCAVDCFNTINGASIYNVQLKVK